MIGIRGADQSAGAIAPVVNPEDPAPEAEMLGTWGAAQDVGACGAAHTDCGGWGVSQTDWAGLCTAQPVICTEMFGPFPPRVGHAADTEYPTADAAALPRDGGGGGPTADACDEGPQVSGGCVTPPREVPNPS